MGCTESQERLLIQSLASERDDMRKLEMELRSQVNMYQFEINILKEQVKKRENKESRHIQTLKSQLDGLVEELGDQKSWKSYRILKNLIKNYREVYHYSVYWGLSKWKHSYSSQSSMFAIENNEINEDILTKDINTESAFLLISQDNKRLLSKSLIWDLYTKSIENCVSNMPISKVIRLFEDMMDLKYSQDQRDIEEKRKPKSIPDFMVDFLNRSFGLKNLAYKNLSQIIPTLVKNSDTNNYLLFFCRLLHIHHPNPIGYTISLFLIKMRIEFNNLINSRTSIISKFNKNTQNNHKLEGNLAFLNDAFNLIYNILDKSRFARSLLLSLIRPEHITKENYYLFYIAYKMSRVPISPEELFDILDMKKEGVLSNRTLVQGIVRQLDLWISTENVEIIFNAFESLTSGKVSKQCFVSKLNPKVYYKNTNNEKYMVSKCRFLEAVLELYNIVKLKTTALLLVKITADIVDFLDGESFASLVKTLDPTICEDFYDNMLEEIKNMHRDKIVTKDNLVKTLVEYGIGDKTLKCFGKLYLVLQGLTSGFDKRRSEIIGTLIDQTKSELMNKKLPIDS